MLKVMDEFYDDGTEIGIEYQLDEDYDGLLAAYDLQEIAGSGSNFSKAEKLMTWISDNIYHNGNYDNSAENTATALFAYALGKGKDFGINCRSLSIALTECLLAIGIKARVVYIMPFSPYDHDNHVVVEAWIDSLGKWVMLDPTYNLFFSRNDEPLGVLELRKALANQEELAFSEGANYNGEPLDFKEKLEYFAKDLFWFIIESVQGHKPDGRNIIFAPVGFCPKKAMVANTDFRIKEVGEQSWLIEQRENLKKWEPVRKNTKILG